MWLDFSAVSERRAHTESHTRTSFSTNFLPPTKPPKYALPLLGIDKLGYRGVFNAVTARLMTAFEYLGVQRGLEYQKVSSGYVAIQATKPATLGYALYGNPVGIASWFLEKYKVWTDPRSPAFAKAEGVEPLTRFSDETMLCVATFGPLLTTAACSGAVEKVYLTPFPPFLSSPYSHLTPIPG